MRPPFDISSQAWKRLAEEERYELIAPICAKVKLQIAGLSKVNYVDHYPEGVVVCTSESAGCLLNGVPDSVDGIPVEQYPIRKVMDEYLMTWNLVLERLAGWPSARIANVANDGHIAFTNPDGLHHDAISYVTRYLISDEIADARGLNRMEVCRRIEHEVSVGLSDKKYSGFPADDPHYNWEAALERILAVNSAVEGEGLA